MTRSNSSPRSRASPLLRRRELREGGPVGMLKFAVSAAVALGVAIIAACSTSPAMANPQAPSAGDGYRLGAGDEIKVTVYDEPALSGPKIVDGQGAVTLDLIG